jgi:hypothetical protein
MSGLVGDIQTPVLEFFASTEDVLAIFVFQAVYCSSILNKLIEEDSGHMATA